MATKTQRHNKHVRRRHHNMISRAQHREALRDAFMACKMDELLTLAKTHNLANLRKIRKDELVDRLMQANVRV